MTDIKQKFGSNNQALTITLASLANNSARASTYVDNVTSLFMDALLFLNIKTASTGTTSTGYVNIYAYGTSDGGTNYSEGATGSDAALTLVSPTNLPLIGVMNCVAVSTTYKSGPMSVARAFGGVLPERWGIVIENKTGGAFDATEGSHLKIYQGLLMQSA